MTLSRYAIYFAPDPVSPLWRLGSSWLGRDAATGERLARPEIEGLATSDIAAVTEAPAHYGFHATLKPPFRLASGMTKEKLLKEAGKFAAARMPVTIPELAVRTIGDFIALMPPQDIAGINELAAACVRSFDPFRAPADAHELERRRRTGLTPRQETLLRRWGYPYVMDAYRFHMTLTGALASASRARICRALTAHFASITVSAVTVDAIAVFEKPAADAPFRVLARFPLLARP